MGKRNWAKIAKWTALGTLGTVVASCEGFKLAYSHYQAEDTQAVTTAMTELAKQPVKLIKINDACIDAEGDSSCKDAAVTAVANAGRAKFDGAYYAAYHDGSAPKAFSACASNHGWSECKLAADGAFVTKQPDVIMPVDAKDSSKAQLIWMLPGYQTVNVGMAADGKKYYLDLKP